MTEETAPVCLLPSYGSGLLLFENNMILTCNRVHKEKLLPGFFLYVIREVDLQIFSQQDIPQVKIISSYII